MDDESFSERDWMILRLGMFATHDYAPRILKLFMGLNADHRARCLFDDEWFEIQVNDAVAIIKLQTRGGLITPNPSPAKRT